MKFCIIIFSMIVTQQCYSNEVSSISNDISFHFFHYNNKELYCYYPAFYSQSETSSVDEFQKNLKLISNNRIKMLNTTNVVICKSDGETNRTMISSILDKLNGYIGISIKYYENVPSDYTYYEIWETALFKQSNNIPILLISDFNGEGHGKFNISENNYLDNIIGNVKCRVTALSYENGAYYDISKAIIPNINISNFITDKISNEFQDISLLINSILFHYQLPRYGTTLKIVVDYPKDYDRLKSFVTDQNLITEFDGVHKRKPNIFITKEEFKKWKKFITLIKYKAIELNWNRNEGIFEIGKRY